MITRKYIWSTTSYIIYWTLVTGGKERKERQDAKYKIYLIFL